MSAVATLRHARPHRSRASVVLWLLIVSLVVVWWEFLAPAQIGGGSSFVVVVGTSMEPMLHSGDLALAQARSDYQVGDLVVYSVESGSVIHRIVGGSTAQGWVTKGDNNWWLDPWRVHNRDIAGEYYADIPGAGATLVWLLRHPFAFGAMVAGAAALAFLPWRRRRIHPVLAAALINARKEPRDGGRTAADYAMLTCALAATTVTYAATLLMVLRQSFGIVGAIVLLALVASATLATVLLYRLYDGIGVADVRRSLLALSGDLYRVEQCPHPPAPLTRVTSAHALRSIADRFRLPVLHHIAPVVGDHTFIVITADHGSYCWAPPMHDGGATASHIVDALVNPHTTAHAAGAHVPCHAGCAGSRRDNATVHAAGEV